VTKNINKMTTIQIPSIFTANTYFWSSASNASSRRRNEDRRQDEAVELFQALGMEVSRSGDSVTGTGHGLVVTFSYSESCKNVYKHLDVKRNGKNSNITSLRKVVDQFNAQAVAA